MPLAITNRPYAARARTILFNAAPDKRKRLDALFADWKKQFGAGADDIAVKLSFDAMLEDELIVSPDDKSEH